jgi:hypothetical protein
MRLLRHYRARKQDVLEFLGEGAQGKVTGILAGRADGVHPGRGGRSARAVGTLTKLVGQIGAAAVLVASGMRIEAFVLLELLDERRRDGVLGGDDHQLAELPRQHGRALRRRRGDRCAVVLPGRRIPTRRWCGVVLMVFAGAVGGFLYHNLAPARIFMGDAGSMFNGYMLATVSLLGTFHRADTPSPIAVTAPLFALAVPLFDTVTVLFIRWRAGVPLMKGDKRHFSHRLVQLGMSPRQAVEFIFLVGGVVGLGGALLSQLSPSGIAIIIAQTVGVFLLIVLLMNAGKRKNGDGSDGKA